MMWHTNKRKKTLVFKILFFFIYLHVINIVVSFQTKMLSVFFCFFFYKNGPVNIGTVHPHKNTGARFTNNT